jgi:hypothetical protein
MSNQQKIAEAKQKLEALKKFTNCRFLQGNLLNALQQVHVDNVRLARLRVDQNYLSTPGTPAKTSDDGVVTPARPGTVTEKIVVLLEARDSSASPGDQVNKMKDAMTNQPYFKAALNKTNGVQLINLLGTELGPDGKPFVPFTLQCNFQEVSR